jgi:hypothetical protein
MILLAVDEYGDGGDGDGMGDGAGYGAGNGGAGNGNGYGGGGDGGGNGYEAPDSDDWFIQTIYRAKLIKGELKCLKNS